MPRLPRHSARILFLGLILLALPASGCFLQPREHEPPEDKDLVVWVDPVMLGNALGNMKRSLESESKDLTNYGRSLSEEVFELILDPGDEAELGGSEFEEWDSIQEGQRMEGILTSTPASLSVFWVPADSLDQGEDVRYYEDLHYRLAFVDGTSSVEYSGRADIYFQDDGTGLWYITKWVDKRDGSSNRTWGWLHARNMVEF